MAENDHKERKSASALCLWKVMCTDTPTKFKKDTSFFWGLMIFLLMVYLFHLFVLVWSSNPCHSRGPSCVPHALRRLGGGGHGSNRGWGWNAIETPKEITLETLQLWLQYYQYYLGMCVFYILLEASGNGYRSTNCMGSAVVQKMIYSCLSLWSLKMP